MSGPYWDDQFNTVTGCSGSQNDPCCANCWARAMHERFSDTPFNKPQLHNKTLCKPLRRKPTAYFVCNTGDLFDPWVPSSFIAATFGVMAAYPQHEFLVLTKCAARMRDWFRWIGDGRQHTDPPVSVECGIHAANQGAPVDYGGLPDVWPLPNVWIGVTAGTQETADERIPLLLATPAARRWVSIEPALSMIQHAGLADVDQIVWGAESGRGMRYACQTWARNLIQYVGARTSIFIKQIHDDNDRLVTDPALFPADLRVRELGWRPEAS